ncbi:MAG: HNH endonuclease [Phycisphaerae bacterium]|nr:HNH endonuclease [Phycisphaerae bacterium]
MKQSTIPYWDKIKSILEYAMSQRKAARTIPELAPDDIERFWSKVKFGNGGCWLWTAGVNGDGYGTFDLRTKSIRAHRISWALVNGPIGANLLVCHACDHPNCVNPKHLFTGTDADNHKDRNQKGRTARGERTGRAKLTSKQVIDIRKRYASGGITERALAAKYDVTQGNVHCVISRKSWTHI